MKVYTYKQMLCKYIYDVQHEMRIVYINCSLHEFQILELLRPVYTCVVCMPRPWLAATNTASFS